MAPHPLPDLLPLPDPAAVPALLAPLAATPRFHNWATTFTCQPRVTYSPASIHDTRLVLHHALATAAELRVRGSGHSPSDLVCVADGAGIMMDLAALSGIRSVDGTEVYFLAGTLLSTVISSLAALSPPLALPSLGSISDQTLAGAFQTATHGSGLGYGNLSTFITFLDLLLPLPGVPLVRVSPTHDPDLFHAALCGLGACGVVVGVGIRAEPRFKLVEECWSMAWPEFQAHWPALVQSSEHVRAWWYPQVGQIKVSRMNRTTLPLTPPPSPLYSFVLDTVLSKHLHALGLLLSRVIPSFLPTHARVMYALVHNPQPLLPSLSLDTLFPFNLRLASPEKKTSPTATTIPVPGTQDEVVVETASPPTTTTTASESSEVEPRKEDPWKKTSVSSFRVAWAEDIFTYDCGFPQYTTELSLPLSTLPAVLSDLTDWVPTAMSMGMHFPIELRWTKADQIWLSPTYSETSEAACYFGAIQYRPYNLPSPSPTSLFTSFESLLKPHRARPHWAKSHSWTPAELERLYPRLADWKRVRERVDPTGVLVNDYLRRHLGV